MQAKHRPGATDPAHTADFDELTLPRPSVRCFDLTGRFVGIDWKSEVGPVDHLRRPRGPPLMIHVEPERPRRIVLSAIHDRRRTNHRAVGERHVGHRISGGSARPVKVVQPASAGGYGVCSGSRPQQPLRSPIPGFKTWGVRSRRPLVVDVEVLAVVLSLSRPEGAPSGRRRLGPRGMQLGSFIRR